MNTIQSVNNLWQPLKSRLNAAGHWLPPFFLRALLFWEFYEAGVGKLRGENWFSSIQQNFPPVFRSLNADTLWLMAAWGETVFAVLLLLGLFTRFAAFSLIIITAVALYAVHWPDSYDGLSQLWQGYAISNDGYGNFKLPLIYMVMLLPLVFSGAGKISLDYLMNVILGVDDRPRQQSDFISKGLTLLILALPLLFFFPILSITMAVIGLVLIASNNYITPHD
ncbi:MAG: DoxX family protein [Proteobacteria bacterium]|nr:DoxX family protein [Pseudomonadota bacterium]